YFTSFFLCTSWQYLVLHPRYIPGFFIFLVLLVMGDSYLTQAHRRPKLHRVTPLHDILMTLIGGGVIWRFRGQDAELNETTDWVSPEDELARLELEMEEEEVEESEEEEEASKDKKKKESSKERKPDVTKTWSFFSVKALNPMSLVLGPLQIVLKNVCMQLRTFNNLFTWKDPFVSFWTTIAVFFLWIVVTVFPYGFFFFWTFRLLGAVLFGPQNVFIGLYLERKKKNEKA
ncbi:hypothetical protein TeGR_g11816, partial [Tetraparma gracilis]